MTSEQYMFCLLNNISYVLDIDFYKRNNKYNRWMVKTIAMNAKLLSRSSCIFKSVENDYTIH